MEIVETEQRTRAAVALCVDTSWSMVPDGRWVPMKRTALALHQLISTRFRGDDLKLITFGRHASSVELGELVGLEGAWEQGTNLHHALLLAGEHLRRHPDAQPVVLVVTDGEPTAHLEADGDGGVRLAAAAGRRCGPPSAEVDRLAGLRASITFFLLGDDPRLAAFVDDVARRCGGRVVAPTLDGLGAEVVVRLPAHPPLTPLAVDVGCRSCRPGLPSTFRGSPAGGRRCGCTTPPAARCGRPRPARPPACTSAGSPPTTPPTSGTPRPTWRSTWSTGCGGISGTTWRYVQNVTDIDDPLLERAARDQDDWVVLGMRETALFREDMAALRVIPPRHYIGAVEAMGEIAELVGKLLGAGRRVPGRGPGAPGRLLRLDGRPGTSATSPTYDEPTMIALSRERGGDPDRPGKRHPTDPLLWRMARDGEPSWESDLGAGPPRLARRVRGHRPEPAGHRRSTSTAAAPT